MLPFIVQMSITIRSLDVYISSIEVDIGHHNTVMDCGSPEYILFIFLYVMKDLLVTVSCIACIYGGHQIHEQQNTLVYSKKCHTLYFRCMRWHTEYVHFISIIKVCIEYWTSRCIMIDLYSVWIQYHPCFESYKRHTL